MSRWSWMAVICAALALTACGDDSEGEAGGADRAQAILALEGDANAAAANFAQTCQTCHGADGSGTPSGDDLTASNISDREATETILFGSGTMAAYGSTFSDQEVADLVALVQTF